ncbi:hypothetical protein F2Q70_00007195 [Brassica cretica]|uniref:RRM domain-containing protein n=1 Tax=Brassica cretica TaxID=69181 RepID=A0A8S9MAY5_BRACR|nr:hypothetical protein F2Q68_00000220 [Brassica cretica]KAF2614383.1 hypothetical protein F2Q70_00007195 [Brassica cretica]
MDEYSSMKAAAEGKKLPRSDLMDTAKRMFEEQRRMVKISVEGYDTSIPAVDIGNALTSRFSSCGRICYLDIPRDPITNVVNSKCSFFQLCGEGAEEKALALDGTDMGGWNVIVKVLPHDDLEFTTDQLAAMSISHFKKTSSQGVSSRGYELSLSEADVKSALTKHFASCGEITDVFVLKRRAIIYFFGWHAISKAVELSGSNVGGCELVVKALRVPRDVNMDST